MNVWWGAFTSESLSLQGGDGEEKLYKLLPCSISAMRRLCVTREGGFKC